MTDFGSKLRRRAVADRLARATGICSYVITVLVPELAMILVKDDMKVCDRSAREILRESAGLERCCTKISEASYRIPL